MVGQHNAVLVGLVHGGLCTATAEARQGAGSACLITAAQQPCSLAAVPRALSVGAVALPAGNMTCVTASPQTNSTFEADDHWCHSAAFVLSWTHQRFVTCS